MTIDDIRPFAKAVPFKPFQLVRNDGRAFNVRHPDSIFLPPVRGTWVYVLPPKGHAADHMDVSVIDSIRLLKPKSKRRRKAG